MLSLEAEHCYRLVPGSESSICDIDLANSVMSFKCQSNAYSAERH